MQRAGERRKAGESGERERETLEMRNSESLCSVWQTTAGTGLPEAQHHHPHPPSVTNFLHPPPPLSWGPVGKRTIPSISLLTPVHPVWSVNQLRTWSTKTRASGTGWVSNERRDTWEEIVEMGVGERHLWPSLFPKPTSTIPLPSCHPTKPANLKLASSKERECWKNSLSLCVPLVLHYCTVLPQDGEISGLLGLDCA